MKKYRRSLGEQQQTNQSDIQAQLRFRPYFVPGPRQGHQKKFGRGAKTNSYCWCIDPCNFEEFGVREVSDEEWANSFYRDGSPENGSLPPDEWVDPHKGDLFKIVDALNAEGTDE